MLATAEVLLGRHSGCARKGIELEYSLKGKAWKVFCTYLRKVVL